MALTVNQIADLLNGTLANLGPVGFHQIAQAHPQYTFVDMMFHKDKMSLDNGHSFKRQVMLNHSDAAKNTGLHDTDTVILADVLDQLEIPWRFTTTQYSMERREPLMDNSPAKLVDLLKLRRMDGMLALIELMELNGWSNPSASADVTTPWGIPHYIIKDSTTGFTGENPSGFSDCAGIDASAAANAKWRNYSFQYVAVSASDLLVDVRRAMRKTNFVTPRGLPDVDDKIVKQFRLFTNDSVISDMEDLAVAQNNQLGRDLASMHEKTLINRTPLIYTPQLDADSSDPIYGVNTKSLHVVALKGDVMNESGFDKNADKHNTLTNFVDTTWNLACVDRRRNFVGYV